MGKTFKFGEKKHHKRKQRMRMFNLTKTLRNLQSNGEAEDEEGLQPDIVQESSCCREEETMESEGTSSKSSDEDRSQGYVEMTEHFHEQNGDEANNSEEEDESDQQGVNEIEGRRIVDLREFLKQLRHASGHNNGSCPFYELKTIKEIRIGFHSKFIFQCDNCRKTFRVYATDDEKTTDTLDINSLAVIAANMIGIGYSQLEQFASIIDVPAMCNDKYKSLNDIMGKFWEGTAETVMREAAEEEARLAIERGDVDPIDGIPFITVVTDEAWSKRSYNRNFTALSGVGAIVGAHTGKVVWAGVRNRYCVICVRATNQGVAPRPHSCTKNFTGPSSEMEWETILEGFKSSVELYNLRYMKVISDGDSSTYSKLLQNKPYQDRHIEKIECTNHLFRNFRKNIEAAVKGCPRGLNKLLIDSLERIRKDMRSAINFRKKWNVTEDEKISLLKSDLNNVLHHVFGDHSNCPAYIKGFCKDDANYVPALEQCNTFEKMSAVMRKMMYCAKDLLIGETNNAAEHFNSIVAKFIGGKRVNFSLSNAYGYRSNAAVVQHNTGKSVSSLYKVKFNTDAPALARKIELKRLRKSDQGKKRRQIMKENKIFRTPFCRKKHVNGTGYGPGSQQADLSEENFNNEKRIHFEKLRKHHENRISNEENTRKKEQSALWNEIVPKIILSKDFGSICKAKSLALYVKELTQRKLAETKSMRHQRESQSIALEQFGAERNMLVRASGLYLDDDHIFLGASPTGIVVDADMIVEIQCPLSITNMDPNDLIVLAKLDFMTVSKETQKPELRKSHNLYFDIQGKLRICQKNMCLFVIWTSNHRGVYVERIKRDDNFFDNKMKDRLVSFYNNWLVPELVDSRLSRGMAVREPNQ